MMESRVAVEAERGGVGGSECEEDGVGGGSECCGRNTGLYNREWTGRLRLYEEVGSWRMEPGTAAQSS